ncbi:MAG TPA: peptidoglycan-binding domain-containing protein [Isosphaeraceae bacterium]
MPSSRKPGPLGVDGIQDDIRDGTLVRQTSPRPGPVGRVSPHPARAAGSGPTRPPAPKATQAVTLPVLRAGSHGPDVAKLQRLLNARLTPSPGLKPDGQFGPRTAQAVGQFQQGARIAADRVVGKVTWYHLLQGGQVHLEPARTREQHAASPRATPPPAPRAPAGQAVGGPTNGTAAGLPRASAAQPADDGIWEWPLQKKIRAVVERVPSRLVGEARREWDALVTPEGLALTLVILAGFCLLSGGTALVLGLVILGLDVGTSLAGALLTASQAATEQDLDDAADGLAHVVIAIGVAAFLHGVGRVAGKIRARGGPKEPPKAPAPKAPESKAPAPKAEGPVADAPEPPKAHVKDTQGPPAVGKKVSQKQLRHVKDRPEWVARGKGGYFNSGEDAQKVLDAYHNGTAKVIGQTKSGNIVVEYPGVTGYNNNPVAGFVDQPTSKFMIKGTSSPSVVPISPVWTP